MEIIGHIDWVGNLQTGTSQNGDWKSIDFKVTETDVQYPQSALMRAKGAMADKVNALANLDGTVDGRWRVSFSLQARTFRKQNGENGTLTDINCWAINKLED